MSNDPGAPGPEDGFDDVELDESEMGEPIAELQSVRRDPPPGFVGRVLSSLYRRDLTNQLATFSWRAMAEAVVEFLNMIFAAFNPPPTDEKGTDS